MGTSTNVAKTLANISKVVKVIVLKSMKKSCGRLMLGMADLGNLSKAFREAFFQSAQTL